MAWSMLESYQRMTPHSAHEFRTIWPALPPANNGRIYGPMRCEPVSNGRCVRVAYRTRKWYRSVVRICVGKYLSRSTSKREFVKISYIQWIDEKNAYQSTWKTFWWHYQNDNLMVLNWLLRDRLLRTRFLEVEWSNFYGEKKILPLLYVDFHCFIHCTKSYALVR